MYILQIEHPVPNYEGWRKAFENDPIDRKGSGVQHYRISRKPDDKNYVLVELTFDTLQDAVSCYTKLHSLLLIVDGAVVKNPQYRIIEMVEDEDIY